MTEMQEDSIEEEVGEEVIFSESIYLVHPEFARAIGIETDIPVFLPGNIMFSHGTDQEVQQGDPRNASFERDSEGNPRQFRIGEDLGPRSLNPGLDTYEVAADESGFLAILEPAGRVKAELGESYGLIGAVNVEAESVRVKGIRAYCMSEDKEHMTDSCYAKSSPDAALGIQEGFIVLGPGRSLKPVCADHTLFPYEVQFRFNISDQGQINFSPPGGN